MPFHPCGQVMDYSRVAYITKMRLWRDSDSLTPVRWFRASAGAKLVEGPSVFRSWKTWHRGVANEGGMGEQTAHFSYDRGANPLGYHGRVRCGSDRAIQEGGQQGVDEEMETEANGSLACCELLAPVELCGVMIPQMLWCRITTGSACACGDGVQFPIYFRRHPFAFYGLTNVTTWWGPIGLPPPDWGPAWPPPVTLIPLGVCEVGWPPSALVYVWASFNFAADECSRRVLLLLYARDSFDPDKVRILASWSDVPEPTARDEWPTVTQKLRTRVAVGTCDLSGVDGWIRVQISKTP